MAEVAAVAEVEADKFIARLQTCHEDCHVGLCAAMGLHIGIFGTEKTFYTFTGKLLNLVNHLATAVVAFAGISLGIFVCKA